MQHHRFTLILLSYGIVMLLLLLSWCFEKAENLQLLKKPLSLLVVTSSFTMLLLLALLSDERVRDLGR